MHFFALLQSPSLHDLFMIKLYVLEKCHCCNSSVSRWGPYIFVAWWSQYPKICRAHTEKYHFWLWVKVYEESRDVVWSHRLSDLQLRIISSYFLYLCIPSVWQCFFFLISFKSTSFGFKFSNWLQLIWLPLSN